MRSARAGTGRSLPKAGRTREWIERKEARNPILRRAFAYYQENCAKLRKLIDDKQRLVARRILEDAARFVRGPQGRPAQGGGPRVRPGQEEKGKAGAHAVHRVPPRAARARALLACLAGSGLERVPSGKRACSTWSSSTRRASSRRRGPCPALYRGRRKVVAGDEKQLRPHDLFQMRAGDDDDGGGGGGDEWDGEAADIESLLDLARRRYPHAYAAVALQVKVAGAHRLFKTAPFTAAGCSSPRTSKRRPRSRPYSGSGARGACGRTGPTGSRPKRLWTCCTAFLGAGAGAAWPAAWPTVGIITFNDAQRDKILDVIEARRARDPEFEGLYEKAASPESGRKDDELFVRNIENVQGDEREVIIFSVGYARDADGRFRMSFGLAEQGRRREPAQTWPLPGRAPGSWWSRRSTLRR